MQRVAGMWWLRASTARMVLSNCHGDTANARCRLMHRLMQHLMHGLGPVHMCARANPIVDTRVPARSHTHSDRRDGKCGTPKWYLGSRSIPGPRGRCSEAGQSIAVCFRRLAPPGGLHRGQRMGMSGCGRRMTTINSLRVVLTGRKGRKRRSIQTSLQCIAVER